MRTRKIEIVAADDHFLNRRAVEQIITQIRFHGIEAVVTASYRVNFSHMDTREFIDLKRANREIMIEAAEREKAFFPAAFYESGIEASEWWFNSGPKIRGFQNGIGIDRDILDIASASAFIRWHDDTMENHGDGRCWMEDTSFEFPLHDSPGNMAWTCEPRQWDSPGKPSPPYENSMFQSHPTVMDHSLVHCRNLLRNHIMHRFNLMAERYGVPEYILPDPAHASRSLERKFLTMKNGMFTVAVSDPEHPGSSPDVKGKPAFLPPAAFSACAIPLD